MSHGTDFSIVALVMRAPITGVQRRWPGVWHAVDVGALAQACHPGSKTVESRCGKRVAVLAAHTEDEFGELKAPIMWPPRVSTLPDGVTRCPDCVNRNERPRSELARKTRLP